MFWPVAQNPGTSTIARFETVELFCDPQKTFRNIATALGYCSQLSVAMRTVSAKSGWRVPVGRHSLPVCQKGHPMNIKTALLALAAAGFLSSPMMVTTASADTMKSCAATWKGMAPTDKALTTHKAFLSSCMEGAPKQIIAVRPDQRLAPLPCHDYSDCTTQEVTSDPR